MLLEKEYPLMACSIAGIPMDKVRGTNTSVYSGIMFRDYHDTQVRDATTLPRYFILGTAASMASNRVSHFFDLRGPSMSVDTACSSTITALHLACQSLRKGESGISIVTGSSLMLNADLFIGMSNIGSALSVPPKEELHQHFTNHDPSLDSFHLMGSHMLSMTVPMGTDVAKALRFWSSRRSKTLYAMATTSAPSSGRRR